MANFARAHLPGCDNASSDELAVAAAKAYFKDTVGWLIIVDDAEDVEVVLDLIPPTKGGENSLFRFTVLTARWQGLGLG